MKKKGVVAGVLGLSVAGAVAALYATDNLPIDLPGVNHSNVSVGQSGKVENVNEHNARIAQTPRENMIIECSNQIEFANSFAEMKSKMPEADQKALDNALNAVIVRKKLSERDIDENLCREFKGWSEKRFLEEAGK